MTASITSRTFGFLPGGERVRAWTLTGQGGLLLEAIEWGGTVTRLLTPDREGCLGDVVLGYRDLDSYRGSNAFFGAIIGRVAGRITGARFSVQDTEFVLTANDGPNHLHGGREGFHRQLWAGTPVGSGEGIVSLRLSHTSPASTEGYPGTVQVTVTYTITQDNRFLIETEAVSDRATPFSLTHHSYFNLAGSTRSIAEHDLQIFSDSTSATDASMTLLGRLEPVSEANDFRASRNLGAAIPNLFANHGDLYRLHQRTAPDGAPALMRAARLTDRRSGRVLDVGTTEEYLQFYTAASLDEQVPGKDGRRYGRYAGVCLECQGYPDGANVPHLGDIMLQAGLPRRTLTEYAFSAEPHSVETSSTEPMRTLGANQ